MEKAALGAKAGGDTHIIELSKKGDLLGHKIVILTSNSGKLLLHTMGRQLELYQVSIPFERFLLKGRFGVAVLYALRPLEALFFRSKRRFDVIVAPSHYPTDVLSALLLHLRNPNSKIIIYFHGISVPPEHGLLLRTISTGHNYFGILLTIKLSDLVFVINRPSRDLLHHFGVKDTKIALTQNGINICDIKPTSHEKPFDACFLSRLTKSKGTSDLIKVWKKVCETRNARLAIIGDGSEKQHINELSLKLGLENNIILLGLLSGDRKYEMLQASKVFVFPSYQESWGIAIAEAMACGLPAIAYNLPIYKEVFEDKLITVSLGDINAMAKQIICLLENPEDAKKTGEAGREFVKRYDWSILAERELAEIQACVTKRE
jgi:glycosyltransferase involved in cell wall biosynthesis